MICQAFCSHVVVFLVYFWGLAQCGAQTVSTKPILVALKKLVVPVRKNGKVVSYKSSFAGEIALGQPHRSKAQQGFSVIFDTGSGQVIVPDERCKSRSCRQHKRYDLTKSSSDGAHAINADGSLPKERRDEVDIKFGTGEITGQLVRETMCLGKGQPHQDQTCVNMNIVTAVKMSDTPFVEFEFDGIIGLSLGGLSASPEFSFLNRLSAHGGHSQFGIYIAPSDATTGHEIAIAGYNKARVKGPLNWAPVVEPQRGFWQVRIRSVRIGNDTLNVCRTGGCLGIVDSGSSHLGVPKDIRSLMTDMLSMGSANVEDCRQVETPDVHLDFEGFSLSLRAQDYMRTLPVKKRPAVGGQPLPTCTPKLVPVAMPASFGANDFFVLGEPVFSRYYTVFEWDSHKIGFGTARHPGDEVPDSELELEDDAEFDMLGTEDSILLLQVEVEFSVAAVGTGTLATEEWPSAADIPAAVFD